MHKTSNFIVFSMYTKRKITCKRLVHIANDIIRSFIINTVNTEDCNYEYEIDRGKLKTKKKSLYS